MAAFRTPEASGGHRPEHVEWMEALVVGDAGARAAEVREELAACPQCSGELATLDDLLGDLDRAGAFERAVLRDANSEGSSQAEPWNSKPSDPATTAPAAHARPRLPLRALALAAAAVLLFIGFDSRRTADEAVPVYLSAEPVPGMEPSGSVESFPSTFRWDLELPIGGWFDVQVFRSDTDGLGPTAPLASASFLKTNEWTWTDIDTDKLPNRLRWEVQVYDATGFPGTRVSAELSRFAPSSDS